MQVSPLSAVCIFNSKIGKNIQCTAMTTNAFCCVLLSYVWYFQQYKNTMSFATITQQ